MSTVALIDISGIFHACFHAAAGEDADAAFRVTLRKVRQYASRYDHAAICCDAGGKTFRHDISADYKATRPERDPALIAQLQRTIAELESDGVVCWRAPGFEADDIIATAARWGEAQGHAVTIVSGDKDLLQLVSSAVQVMKPSDESVWGPQQVVAKLDVEPSQVGDLLALCGDKADNIAGVPGVGPKHAARMLQRFGDIAGILAAVDQIDADGKPLVEPPSIRKALNENRDVLALACRLVALRDNLPIDCSECLKPREPKRMQNVIDSEFEDEERAAIADETPPAMKPEPARIAPEMPPPAATKTEPAGPGVSKAMTFEATTAAMVVSPSSADWNLALDPTSLGATMKLALALHESRMFPKYPNPQAIFAGILMGRSLGLSAMTALRGIYPLDGKQLALYTQLIVALVLKSGLAEFFERVEGTDQKCIYETKRVGGRRIHTCEFTIADAERAGLVKPNSGWTKFPRSMLVARASAELARLVYPDVCSNCYDPSELESAA